jgi:hypothetical protein
LRYFLGDDFFFAIKDEGLGSAVFLKGQWPVILVVLGLGKQRWPGFGEMEVDAVLDTANGRSFLREEGCGFQQWPARH